MHNYLLLNIYIMLCCQLYILSFFGPMVTVTMACERRFKSFGLSFPYLYNIEMMPLSVPNQVLGTKCFRHNTVLVAYDNHFIRLPTTDGLALVDIATTYR